MIARLLAFDTATEAMAVALHTGTQALTHDGPGGASASSRLLPEIHALLARTHLRLQDLQAIAFGVGPGAFTGLRKACSVAQGLAFGAGLPVLAVDSLMIVAESVREASQRAGEALNEVCVAMDARMGEVYAGDYHWVDGRWHCTLPPQLYTLAALNARWQARPPHCVAGSAVAAFAGRLQSGDARLLPGDGARAAALLRLAQGLWCDGEGMSALQAQPLYLRDKVALSTAERDAPRVAGVRA